MTKERIKILFKWYIAPFKIIGVTLKPLGGVLSHPVKLLWDTPEHFV